MEWVALFVWLFVVMTALPLGAGAVLRPEFGLAALDRTLTTLAR